MTEFSREIWCRSCSVAFTAPLRATTHCARDRASKLVYGGVCPSCGKYVQCGLVVTRRGPIV